MIQTRGMVEEYAERNELYEHCPPATRSRQRQIYSTLRRLEKLQAAAPAVAARGGQTKREIAETRISLRNRVKLPVLGKLSTLHERDSCVPPLLADVTPPKAATSQRRRSRTATSRRRVIDRHHYIAVYDSGALSSRAVPLNRQGGGKAAFSPRQPLPAIKNQRQKSCVELV